MIATHLLERSGHFLQADEFKRSTPDLTWWKAVDQSLFRAYWSAATPPQVEAIPLQLLLDLKGVSYQISGNFHYVVETDVKPEQEEEMNAWYDTEHLVGLSQVAGVITAKRYLRLSGGPRYMACYELESPLILESRDWLAVRHTAWSSRVRPMFFNTFRQHFVRHT